jgi:hypothetical protein
MDQEEIKVGDWISFPAAGFEGRGKVGSVDAGSYGVSMKVGNFWVTTVVGKGDRVKKVDPPEGEE